MIEIIKIFIKKCNNYNKMSKKKKISIKLFYFLFWCFDGLYSLININ